MGRVKPVMLSMPARMVVFMLQMYHRWISTALGPICRFHPSCSVYAIDVIASFGLFKGGMLALKRLFKCHPLHPGGVDLPPKPLSE